MGLQRLEKVYFVVSRGKRVCGDLADAAPCFRIPSIRSTETSDWVSSRTRSSQIFSSQSNVIHFLIRCGGIEPSVVGEILKIKPHLESLHYIHEDLSEPTPLHFQPRVFGDALRMRKHSENSKAEH